MLGKEQKSGNGSALLLGRLAVLVIRMICPNVFLLFDNVDLRNQKGGADMLGKEQKSGGGTALLENVALIVVLIVAYLVVTKQMAGADAAMVLVQILKMLQQR